MELAVRLGPNQYAAGHTLAQLAERLGQKGKALAAYNSMVAGRSQHCRKLHTAGKFLKALRKNKRGNR